MVLGQDKDDVGSRRAGLNTSGVGTHLPRSPTSPVLGAVLSNHGGVAEAAYAMPEA